MLLSFKVAYHHKFRAVGPRTYVRALTGHTASRTTRAKKIHITEVLSHAESNKLTKLIATPNWHQALQNAARKIENALIQLVGQERFGVRTFHATFLFAPGYSFLLVIVAWLFTNSGTIGGFELLPAMDWRLRTLLMGVIVGYIAFALWLWRWSKKDHTNAWMQFITEHHGVIIALGAYIVAFADAVALLYTQTRFVFKGVWAYTLSAMAMFGYLALCASAPLFVDQIAQWFDTVPDTTTKQVLPLLLFLGFLPLCNAISDTLSLGCTRIFINTYQQTPERAVWLGGIDSLVGLCFTLFLWLGVFGVLYMLEQFGWPIATTDIARTFAKSPFEPQVLWITLLALTNVIPTMLHYWIIWHASNGVWWGTDANMHAYLHNKSVRQNGELTLKPLDTPHAQRLVAWLWMPHKLHALLPLRVALAAVYDFMFVVSWLFGALFVAS